MFIQSDNFEVAWGNQLRSIINSGHRVAPRGKETLELLGSSIRVLNPLSCLVKHPARDINPRYPLAEFLWIISGSDSLEYLSRFNKQMTKFSDDGQHLAGAYGPRLMSQMDYIIDKLTNDEVTRQAVATIWTPNPEPSKDIPCTVSIQLLRRPNRYGDQRSDEIHAIVTMRSSDIWLGLVYDFPVFVQIQAMIAGYLDCEVGWMKFQLGSSHLYMSDFEMAKNVLDTPQLGNSVSLPAFKKEDYIDSQQAEHLLTLQSIAPQSLVQNFYSRVLMARRKSEAWAIIEKSL